MKEIGSSTSTTRTAEQTLAARFWAESPVQQAHGVLRKLVLDHQLNIVDAARFMAMIEVTYADALIACFDAKYHCAFWRPIGRCARDAISGSATPASGGHPLPLAVEDGIEIGKRTANQVLAHHFHRRGKP